MTVIGLNILSVFVASFFFCYQLGGIYYGRKDGMFIMPSHKLQTIKFAIILAFVITAFFIVITFIRYNMIKP